MLHNQEKRFGNNLKSLPALFSKKNPYFSKFHREGITAEDLEVMAQYSEWLQIVIAA